jgi:adenylate cyclase
MARSNSSSRFAFILHADVVGSTILVQRDEQIAHQRMQSAFRDLSKKISDHGGTTREVRGDALVAEFEKASDAVCAALAFQKGVVSGSVHSDGIEPKLRIGIAMGEAVFADRTVTGASVVLAQRLEQLASPGGVVIQASAQETVPQRLPIDFLYLGEHEVKGFERPVRAFEARLREGQMLPGMEEDTEAEPLASRRSFNRPGRRFLAMAGIAMGLIVALSLAWWRPWQPDFPPASVERMAYPLPERPSIAVLPFADPTATTELSYLAQGLTRSLSEEFARLPDLFVISSDSSASLPENEAGIQAVAEALGVRYLLQGTLEKNQDQFELRSSLVDAVSGKRLWVLELSPDWNTVFNVPEQLVDRVISSLSLAAREHRGSGYQPPVVDPNAYDLYFRGTSLASSFTESDNRQARELFRQAIELDGNLARAHAALAMSDFHAMHFGWTPSTRSNLDRAHDAATRALSVDDRSPLAHTASGFIWLISKDPAAAIRAAERALALAPDFSQAHLLMGMARSDAGEYDKAIESLQQAVRLNPYPPAIYEMSIGRALLLGGQLEQARVHLERAIEINPTYLWAHVYLVAALESSDDMDQSRLAVARLLSLSPDFRIQARLLPGTTGDQALAAIIEKAIRRWAPASEPASEEDTETARSREYLDSIRNALRRVGSSDRSGVAPDHDSGRK